MFADMIIEIIFGIIVILAKLSYRFVVFLWGTLTHRQKVSDAYMIAPAQAPLPSVPQEYNVRPVPAPQIAEPTIPKSRYNLNGSLLTPAEQEFLKVLEEAVGEEYRITPQVPLSGIVSPKDSNKHFTNYRDFNKISAKKIDFVLYNKETWAPVLAIELDDRSHLRWDRIQRDMFVNELMEGVGLAILHIPVNYSYDVEELKIRIETKVKICYNGSITR